MFISRFFRVLLITFSATLFICYNFYSNKSNPKYNGFYINPSPIYNFQKQINLNNFFQKEQISVFLNYSQSINIEPFIIEPFLLYHYLDSKDQKYLINFNLNPKVFKWKNSLTTFGLKVPFNLTTEEKFEFLDKICKNESLENFNLSCQTFFGEDNTKEWQLNDKLNIKKFDIPVFFVFNLKKKNDSHIQLVLFYSRTKALWTGKSDFDEINDYKLSFLKDDLKFGHFEELFDDFDLKKQNTDLKIITPEKPFSFIIEKNNSRLIECNRVLATEYYKKYSNKDFKDAKFVRQALSSINYFKEMLNEYKIPLWIFSGTLLGWYRQCNIISYTTDVDFAADSRFASQVITDQVMKNKYGFKFHYIWGIPENGYEYSLKKGILKVDLFFIYPAENNQVALFIHTKNNYRRYFYPKFDLCSGQLRGIRINVPCNAETILKTEYGPDWVKPVETWNYITSPKNKGPTEYWPKGIITFREYN